MQDQQRENDHLVWSQISNALIQNTTKNSRICVYTVSKVTGIDAMAGIILAGRTCVPLDVQSPHTRNYKILIDIEPDGLLLDNETISNAQPLLGLFNSFEVINVGKLKFVKINHSKTGLSTPPDIALILYTSGSSGLPKGVMISHKNAVSFVEWASNSMTFTHKDVFSSIAPLHFDLSIFDVFVSFKHKSELKIYEPATIKNPKLLASRISEDKVTTIYATPTVLTSLLHYGNLSQYDFSRLRYVLFAGEVFPEGSLKSLRSIWPDAIFYNLYGPTETNVCTFHKLETNDINAPLPIGQECLPGTTKIKGNQSKGEMLVSGDGVSPGYWNNDHLNSSKFFVENGIRWYCTGDIVEKVDDNYVFHSRNDRMVKRRGYRIELKEIEKTLEMHSEIIATAVVAVRVDEHQIRIKAWYVKTPNSTIYSYQLKSYCSLHLPLYMVPDDFQCLDEMPITSTQKIDYQKLQQVDP